MARRLNSGSGIPGRLLALALLVLVGCGLIVGALAITSQDKATVSMVNRDHEKALTQVYRQAGQALEQGTARHRREQAQKRLVARFRPLPGGVSLTVLEQIASCESGGNPKAVSSNGLYHGKYQFHPDTWRSVGGAGLPSRAPEVEQDYRAAMLLARSGPGQWPVCGA